MRASWGDGYTVYYPGKLASRGAEVKAFAKELVSEGARHARVWSNKRGELVGVAVASNRRAAGGVEVAGEPRGGLREVRLAEPKEPYLLYERARCTAVSVREWGDELEIYVVCNLVSYEVLGLFGKMVEEDGDSIFFIEYPGAAAPAPGMGGWVERRIMDYQMARGGGMSREMARSVYLSKNTGVAARVIFTVSGADQFIRAARGCGSEELRMIAMEVSAYRRGLIFTVDRHG